MSVIAGEVSFGRALHEKLEQFEEMKKALFMRGGLEQSSYLNNTVCLIQGVDEDADKSIAVPYFLKLSENKYYCILDGRLSNSEEMCERLRQKGYELRDGSDCEIITAAYAIFGEECLTLLNGVYAFAIWDSAKQELFFARDRLGVRPLFFTTQSGSFIFSSEIKGLLSQPQITAKIDTASILEIMLIGPGRTLGYGIFNGINELLPAQYGVYSRQGLRLKKYWSLAAYEINDNVKQATERVRELVEGSIKEQLSPDEEVCTMLSGGLDSSVITAVVSDIYKKQGARLQTYSVTYTDNDKYFKSSRFQPESDTGYIEIMLNSTGAENEAFEISSKELADALYEAVDARDLPGMADIDSSLLLFCKKIREKHKIALSGECSDEIFGGYPWYRDEKLYNFDGFPWAHSSEFRKSLLKDDYIKDIDCEEYIYSKYRQTVCEAPLSANVTRAENRKKELMKLNLDWFMMTLVDRTDRMCQRCSLDVRVPFCDYRIAEYLYNLKWEYKELKGIEKGILREAFRDLLPEEVLLRKKSPYPKTHNPEYLGIVREKLKELIEDSSAPVFEFLKRDEITKLLNTEIPENFYGQLMTTPQTIAYILQVDYWLRKYNIEIV
ncbi:MAG: asparagine synthase (glutamine-hydrolyzing) [Clostridia bacterium]|nr:asparagine synthase (glutamine-hydrolyzing) [Clostridia bacterium]